MCRDPSIDHLRVLLAGMNVRRRRLAEQSDANLTVGF